MKQNYFIIYIYLDKLEKQNNLLKNNRLFCLIIVTAEGFEPSLSEPKSEVLSIKLCSPFQVADDRN